MLQLDGVHWCCTSSTSVINEKCFIIVKVTAKEKLQQNQLPGVSVDVQRCIIFGKSCRLFFSFLVSLTAEDITAHITHGSGCGLHAV